jgi:predicted O-linked N-acetylglucosamine transferase (SPINDLY family)
MIDILIDLSGHTAGGRPLLFARKPAPVQATWLGYFGSTGITAIDYLFADAHMVAPEEDSFYAEKVVRLPVGWWCFRPPTDHDSARCEPATSRNGYVTFGCFNNVAKITPEVVGVWARIMRALPDSRILLKNAAFDSPRVHARYADLFAAHGVDTQRVHFAGRSPYADYLAAYAEIDIALDPFPFNGGMTSIEGLWMGVPMVTFRGDRFTSRFGAALLTEVGLKDLIARSDDEYVARAVALARDVERLAALRGGLRERMMLSRICDVQGFTRGLEETYRELWARWCAEASED